MNRDKINVAANHIYELANQLYDEFGDSMLKSIMSCALEIIQETRLANKFICSCGNTYWRINHKEKYPDATKGYWENCTWARQFEGGDWVGYVDHEDCSCCNDVLP